MDDRQARLQQVSHIAVALEAQTGCPAPLLIVAATRTYERLHICRSETPLAIAI
jgi:hypothetical protein